MAMSLPISVRRWRGDRPCKSAPSKRITSALTLPGYGISPITASIDIYDFHIDKKGSDIPVHFFYSPRWTVSLQWREIIHGVFRASVGIYNPQVNLVNGPSDGQSQVGISGVWLDAIRALIPWRVNQLYIYDGDAHFLDFHADPQVDLECSHIEFAADNMANA